MPDCADIPAQLEASKCWLCLAPIHREAVKTYLLAVLAGGSLDPAELLAAATAAGFTGLDKNAHQPIQDSLLCQILNL